MAHKHGKKRNKEEKKSPAKQRIGVEESIHNLHNITAILVCNSCDRNETCVKRIRCTGYESKEISINIVDDGEDLEA